MKVFDSWLYGDPEKVLERKQEEAARKHKECGDCIHKQSLEFRGEIGHFCEFKRHVYGVKRCDLYETLKGEDMGNRAMRDAVDFCHIEDGHREIHKRLVNWARWVAPGEPKRVSPMFAHAKTSRQWDVDPHTSIPVDTIDAQYVEKAVYKLPKDHREALRWWYVYQGSVRDQCRRQALSPTGLQLCVRDGRQMLKNTMG